MRPRSAAYRWAAKELDYRLTRAATRSEQEQQNRWLTTIEEVPDGFGITFCDDAAAAINAAVLPVPDDRSKMRVGVREGFELRIAASTILTNIGSNKWAGSQFVFELSPEGFLTVHEPRIRPHFPVGLVTVAGGAIPTNEPVHDLAGLPSGKRLVLLRPRPGHVFMAGTKRLEAGIGRSSYGYGIRMIREQ